MCGARCRSPSGSAGSAESRSAPVWSGRSRPFCGTITSNEERGRGMRGFSLVSLSILLVGCGAVRDAFTPRAEVVARANDQALSVERLAAWTSTSKQVPLEALAFNRVSHVWVDYALFAEALATERNLHDSATTIASMWPIVSQLKWERFHQRLTAHSDLNAKQLDSAYQSGQLRMFQHILIQVPSNAAATVDSQKRKQAEQVLVRARTAGPRFGQLAKQYSQDNGSKVQGGALRVRDLIRWLSALDPSLAQALPQAGDAQINQFLKAVAQRDLLIREADSAKVGLTPDDWQQVRTQYDSAITLLSSILSITPTALHASAGGRTPGARVKFAMARVDDYMGRVLQGRVRFFPLPPFLG